jgi:hypothetical protein
MSNHTEIFKVPKFVNGYIYKIFSPSHPEILPYYGSTTRKNDRKKEHYSTSNITSSKELISCGDAEFVIVQYCSFLTDRELRNIEYKWINENPCINKRKDKYITEPLIDLKKLLSELITNYDKFAIITFGKYNELEECEELCLKKVEQMEEEIKNIQETAERKYTTLSDKYDIVYGKYEQLCSSFQKKNSVIEKKDRIIYQKENDIKLLEKALYKDGKIILQIKELLKE